MKRVLSKAERPGEAPPRDGTTARVFPSANGHLLSFVLRIFLVLAGVAGSANILSASPSGIEIAGHIDVTIATPPPQLPYPSGSSVIRFTIGIQSNIWDLNVTFPSNYLGLKQAREHAYRKGGSQYAVIDQQMPDGTQFHTAGITDHWQPENGLSDNAPDFMIWLAFLNDANVPDLIPRLFYDHRINGHSSPFHCVAKVLERGSGIPTRIEFQEVRPDQPLETVANYLVEGTTNVGGAVFPLALTLHVDLLVPQISEGMLLNQNGWISVTKPEDSIGAPSKIPGADYRLYVDEVREMARPIAYPISLNPSYQYQFVDGRFQTYTGSTSGQLFIYHTNHWLSKIEAETVLGSQAKSVTAVAAALPSAHTTTIVRWIFAAANIILFGLLLAFYLAARKRKQQPTKGGSR